MVASGALFWDAARPIRLGLEFAWLRQDFVDPGPSVDRRAQPGGKTDLLCALSCGARLTQPERPRSHGR
jgi:hypothetical protein